MIIDPRLRGEIVEVLARLLADDFELHPDAVEDHPELDPQGGPVDEGCGP